MLTLLLIEPTLVLRQSLRNWLEVDLAPCVILEAEDIARAITLAATQAPRLIILDMDAFVAAGQDDIRRLIQMYPQTVIIGIGMDDTPAHRERAELAGVAAFVPKAQLQGELIRVLQSVINTPPNMNVKKP